jgi:hypothetical protein
MRRGLRPVWSLEGGVGGEEKEEGRGGRAVICRKKRRRGVSVSDAGSEVGVKI